RGRFSLFPTRLLDRRSAWPPPEGGPVVSPVAWIRNRFGRSTRGTTNISSRFWREETPESPALWRDDLGGLCALSPVSIHKGRGESHRGVCDLQARAGRDGSPQVAD